MAWKYAAGPYLNALNRPWNLLGAVVPYNVSPAALAASPIGGVNDRWAHVPFQWGTDTNPQFFEVDLNAVAGSGFDVANDLTFWTGTNGSLSATQKESGANSITYTGSAPVTVRAQDIVVETGRPHTIRFWLYSDGTGAAAVSVSNLDTGRWLQAGAGSWGTAAQVQSRSTSGGLAYSFTFTPEPYSLTQRTSQRIRIGLEFNNVSGSHTVYFDNVEVRPQVNYAAVVGHNITQANRLYVDGADTSFSSLFSVNISGGSAAAGYLSPKPTFGASLGADKGYRYYRAQVELLQSNAAVYGQQGMGEFVLAYVKDFASVAPQPGATIGLPYTGQVRYENRAGAKFVYNVNKFPPRKVTAKFFCKTPTEAEQIRDEVHLATEGGRWPMLLVANEPSSYATTPIYGMLQDVMAYTFEGRQGRLATVELVLDEEPTPNY